MPGKLIAEAFGLSPMLAFVAFLLVCASASYYATNTVKSSIMARPGHSPADGAAWQWAWRVVAVGVGVLVAWALDGADPITLTAGGLAGAFNALVIRLAKPYLQGKVKTLPDVTKDRGNNNGPGSI